MKDLTLEVQDYLEAAGESSKRTRTLTIVLVVSTVLTFVGLLNSSPKAWMLDRIHKVATDQQSYVAAKLGPAPTRDSVRQDYQPVHLGNDWKLVEKEIVDDVKEQKNNEAASAEIRKAVESGLTLPPGDLPSDSGKAGIYEDKYHDLDYTYKRASGELSTALIRAYADNSLMLRAPFFGITFDVNDLYLLSGTAFIVILILLRFSLSRELANIKLAFREAVAQDQLLPFYHLLAMRQVFTFPDLPEYRKPAILSGASHLISFLPIFVYSAVYLQDLRTSGIGKSLSADWARLSYVSPMLLALIFLLSVLCSLRVRRIDRVWAEYWYILNHEATITKERLQAVNDRCSEMVRNNQLGQASELVVSTGFKNITGFADISWPLIKLAKYEESYNDARAETLYKMAATVPGSTEADKEAEERFLKRRRKRWQFWRRRPKRTLP